MPAEGRGDTRRAQLGDASRVTCVDCGGSEPLGRWPNCDLPLGWEHVDRVRDCRGVSVGGSRGGRLVDGVRRCDTRAVCPECVLTLLEDLEAVMRERVAGS